MHGKKKNKLQKNAIAVYFLFLVKVVHGLDFCREL